MKINNDVVLEKEVELGSGHFRNSRVYLDQPVDVAANKVDVQLVTRNQENDIIVEKSFSEVVESRKGKILLIHFDKEFEKKGH